MLFKNFSVKIFLFLSVLSVGQSFAARDDEIKIYHYNGVPGCGCFLHCICFRNYTNDFFNLKFSDDIRVHPKNPEDKIWHEFMEKFLSAKEAGPYFYTYWNYVGAVVKASNQCGFICLLSEYLNAIDRLRKKIEFTRIDTIEFYKRVFAKPKYSEELEKHINIVNAEANDALQILSTIPDAIIPLFKELIANCPHKGSYNMVPLYNTGLIKLLEGNIDDSLSDILSFIDLAQTNGKENLLTSEIFQKEGEAFLEVGLYHQAIDALNQAIAKDPKNLEAYFQRASAYFETGDFEKSLEDFIISKKGYNSSHYNLAPNEFIDAFSQAAFQGAYDAASDFFPSLSYTAYGLGKCLWAFGEHPIDAVQNLARTGYDIADCVVDYLKTVDREKLSQYADELVALYQNFSQLSEQEKGNLIGYTLGKYGVDIFAGSAAIKGVSAFKKLKDANRICNLESMTLSASSKEEVISKGLQQYKERCQFFERSSIEWDKQNKHIIGKHNYKKEKSIFEHKDAEGLLRKFAGKGGTAKGELGQPGYREVVDFGEHIGVWKSKDGKLSLNTTKGTIHYSKKGAHIVPEHPSKKIW